MGAVVGSWRLCILRKVDVWEARAAQLWLRGAGISKLELS